MNYLKGLKTDVGIIFWFYIKYGFTQPGIGRQIDSMCSKSQIFFLKSSSLLLHSRVVTVTLWCCANEGKSENNMPDLLVLLTLLDVG